MIKSGIIASCLSLCICSSVLAEEPATAIQPEAEANTACLEVFQKIANGSLWEQATTLIRSFMKDFGQAVCRRTEWREVQYVFGLIATDDSGDSFVITAFHGSVHVGDWNIRLLRNISAEDVEVAATFLAGRIFGLVNYKYNPTHSGWIIGRGWRIHHKPSGQTVKILT